MDNELQGFSYEESTYERPMQKWVCGKACEGTPCVQGPSSAGVCVGSSNCSPLWRDGIWICTRPRYRGGKCKTGPLPDGQCALPIPPCQPVLSLRHRRGLWTAWLTAMTIGILAFVLGRPGARQTWIDPGPLTKHHHAVLGQGQENCGACHAISSSDRSGDPQMETSQNDLCRVCHPGGQHSGDPHDLPPDRLAQFKDQKLAAAAGFPTTRYELARTLLERKPDRSEVACAYCHPEHHGDAGVARDMPNERCSVCHQRQFDRFEHGHPELVEYPTRRRTRIFFSHPAHLRDGGYMDKEGRKDAAKCAHCHRTDALGEVMQLTSYEQMCSACHDDDIQREASQGREWVMMAVPNWNAEAIEGAGQRLPPEWPQSTENRLTAFSQVLLLASVGGEDPEREQLAADLSLIYAGAIDYADPQQVVAASRVADLIKTFVSRLLQGDETLVSQGAARLLSDPATLSEWRALRIPADTLRRSRHWFHAKTAGKQADSTDGTDLDASSSGVAETTRGRVQAGGWAADPEKYRIIYRPTGHADPVLRGWYDLAAASLHRPWGRAVLDRIRSVTEPGACLRCHSIDQDESGAKVHWYGLQLGDKGRPFTRFVHQPHLTFTRSGEDGDDANQDVEGEAWNGRSCQDCHQLVLHGAQYKLRFRDAHPYRDRQQFARTDPRAYVPCFEQLRLEKCQSCHQPRLARNNCGTCHNYHVQLGHQQHVPLPP